jgi:Alginate lyase
MSPVVISGLLVKALAIAAVTVPAVLGGSAAPAAVPGSQPGAASVATPIPSASGSTCGDPAQVLDLTNWKVTLPVSGPDNNPTKPLEVQQPDLDTYATSPWFDATSTCDAVVFRAPVDGVTTKGSKNPRSELREMADNGSTTASWSSTAGTHSIVVNEAFVHLPEVKPELVGVQIHDADDDISVFRLEGRNLYVTKGDDTHYKLVTSDYVLGTKYEAKYVVGDGKIQAYYNGVLQTTIPDRFRGAYFKAGAYTQANCTDSSPCNSDNYGETVVYSVAVTHHVTRWDLIWDWFTAWLPIGVAAVLVIGLGYLIWRRTRVRRA